jgi:putative redox protein
MPYTVIVTGNGRGRYQQEIVVRDRHHLIADEPVSVGGDDAGPAPYDFLMAGLGACTAMTVRIYAERKAMALRNVTVALRFDKVEVDGSKVDRIDLAITLDGDLSPAERQRLLEIANKCPTHRVLEQPLRIDSRLTD